MAFRLGEGLKKHYLEFDGVDDTVILRQENEITTSEINNELTISIEFIPNESEAGYVLWAADGSTPSRPSQMFSILNVDNTIEFNAFGGQLTIPLEIGKKYNITFTATANNEIKLYEDGQFVATSTTSNRNPANNMNIGSRSGDVGNTSQAFHSKVDVYNLQIWNKALTQQEIQGYIQTKPTGNETGLIAYYDFSDGQGTTLTDSAGNNDGTIVGATWGFDLVDNIKDIRLGEERNYLEFDGVDDYVNLGSGSVLDLTQSSFKIEFEFSTTTISQQIILGNIIGDGELFYVYINRNPNHTTGLGKIYTRLRTSNVSIALAGATPDLNLNDGNNHTVIIEYDLSNGLISYNVDGNDVSTSYRSGETGNSISMSIAGEDLYLGAWNNNGTPQDYFNGEIYDLKFFDNQDNLTNHWDFSDGQGTTLTDKAGNNDGTIIGATWDKEQPKVESIYLGETFVYGKKYAYRKGNQFTSLTGGWEEALQNINSSANGFVDFQVNRMRVFVERLSGQGTHIVRASTLNKLDLTKINKLYIDWEDLGTSQRADRVGSSFLVSEEPSFTGEGGTSGVARVSYFEEFQRTIDEIDVSNLEGEFHLNVSVLASGGNSRHDVFVYQIWGEA